MENKLPNIYSNKYWFLRTYTKKRKLSIDNLNILKNIYNHRCCSSYSTKVKNL